LCKRGANESPGSRAKCWKKNPCQRVKIFIKKKGKKQVCARKRSEAKKLSMKGGGGVMIGLEITGMKRGQDRKIEVRLKRGGKEKRN